MKIGTPLSSSSFRVMLLGAGELGKEVIIALQRFAVEVIAVDRYAGAPGHQVAHRSHVIDMTDALALRALVEQERPHLIVPEIEAIATEELLRIEAQGLAQVIPSARAVNLTMNREGIRRLAVEELNLPASRYEFASSRDELVAAINDVTGFPCIIKPVMSSSGKGQSVVKSAKDIDAAWEYALSGGRVRQARIIIEEMIEFDFEITLLTVRALNQQGEVETKFCDPVGHVQCDGDYIRSWQPQPMSERALQRSQHIADQITRSLGGQGLFGVEFFIKGDDVWFSEVSPRPHDTGMVTMVSQIQSEFALHARAILGLPVDTSLRQAGASAVIYGGVNAAGVTFDGVAESLQIPGTEIRLFGKPESFVKRRMGVVLASGKDIEEALLRAEAAAAKVEVLQG